MTIHLATPISQLTRVGAITAKRLAKLDIRIVKNLLEHYPLRYEDYSRIFTIRDLRGGEVGSIIGTISSIENKKTAHKKMSLIEAYLSDGQNDIKIIWFNQPFLIDVLKEGDKIIVAGTVERDWKECLLKNPLFEKYTGADTLHTGRLIPIYPATYGLTQKQIRFLVSQGLEAINEFKEIIPEKIKKQAHLINKLEAMRSIHLPNNQTELQSAINYLKFEELFLTQILTLQARQKLQTATAPIIPFQEQATKNLVNSLPWPLTTDQRKVAWQILKDLSQSRPMNRLLQGEVGSGKTVVASIASLNAAENGYQTALMAPTEILALQHFKTISQLFPNKRVALLTSKHNRTSSVIANEAPVERSNPINTQSDDKIASVASTLNRNDIKQFITEGKIDIIIGTHAIIQNDVSFNKLGLIIIDEQHRFGVEQRKNLRSKKQEIATENQVPHLLSMTATPIPRSLALTVFGDLDISTIKELPQNRKPITTKIITNANRQATYKFMAEKIKAGQQIFVVCPLIEDSDVLGVKSATAEFEKLKKIFPNIKIGLIHGKLKAAEKEQVMTDFKNNLTSILVSTSVIEVGVDIPNASIMAIEGAERFGLSQLHQFRGRIGRGEHTSFCFLLPTHLNDQTKERLQSFVRARNGFEIAELDLALRGPGQIYGTNQSGFETNLKIASFLDSELIIQTKNFAQMIIKEDSELKQYPNLFYVLKNMSKELHLE